MSKTKSKISLTLEQANEAAKEAVQAMKMATEEVLRLRSQLSEANMILMVFNRGQKLDQIKEITELYKIKYDL
tara:strand:- start:1106 stop:1324 length:219 start_codon:yes stop_codon:yes gene_type:complete